MRRFISYAGPKSRFACLRDRFYLPLSGVSMHLLSKFVVVVVVVGVSITGYVVYGTCQILPCFPANKVA